jgi:O-antigen/teichoic acid export membrane protein
VLRVFPVASQAGWLDRLKAVLDWAYGRATQVVIAASLLCLGAVALFGDPGWLAIAAISAPYGIIMGWRARYENQQMAARRRRAVALFQAGDAWARPALAAVLILIGAPLAILALLGYGIVTFGLGLLQARFAAGFVRRGIAAPADASTITRDRRALIRYCWPAALVAGAGAVSIFADRWVLEGLLGVHELGLYFAIYQIANAPAVLFVGIVTQFFLPIIFGKAGALALPEQAAASARILGFTILSFLVLMLPFIGIAFLFSEPIVRIVTGEAYMAYHPLLWIMVSALGLNQLGLILTYKGAYQNRLGLYVAPRLGQAVLLIALMMLMVPAQGVAGAVHATFAAALAYVACLIVINRWMGHRITAAETP